MKKRVKPSSTTTADAEQNSDRRPSLNKDVLEVGVERSERQTHASDTRILLN